MNSTSQCLAYLVREKTISNYQKFIKRLAARFDSTFILFCLSFSLIWDLKTLMQKTFEILRVGTNWKLIFKLMFMIFVIIRKMKYFFSFFSFWWNAVYVKRYELTILFIIYLLVCEFLESSVDKSSVRLCVCAAHSVLAAFNCFIFIYHVFWVFLLKAFSWNTFFLSLLLAKKCSAFCLGNFRYICTLCFALFNRFSFFLLFRLKNFVN